MMKPATLRRTAALLCLPLLLSACGATAQATSIAEPSPNDTTIWPAPRPQNWPRPQPERAVVTPPNFQAPSAAHCARPIETREVPGSAARQERPPYGWRERDEARPAKSGAAPAPVSPSAAAMVEKSRGDSELAAADAPATREATREATRDARHEARGEAGSGRIAAQPAPTFAPPAPPAPQGDNRQRPASETVTAGMVDDNADFTSYLAFRARTRVAHRPRDVRERYLLEVKDARGRGIADAEVAVQSPGGYAAWARTDTAGRAWLHPDAFDPSHAAIYDVAVRKDGRQAQGYLRRGQKSAVEITLDAQAAPSRARLDLVFLIDATGSMADEIDKLKATLRTIADDVARLPSRPDMCFGMVAYRDRTDRFITRSHDFTNDLDAFQGVLNALHADGGGDYPEAMNEALHETVHNLSWRGSGATRLVVLIADAPPHLDYGGPRYDDDMMAALGKGIKIFSVGASGLDKQGEYIQRQIAQYTGGRFVFLTYDNARDPASGPGRETVHDVKNYSVDTLDRLIVRLVSDELGKLARPL